MDKVLMCDCGKSEHQILFRTIDYDQEYLDKFYPEPENRKQVLDEVFVDFHLTKLPFWNRVKYGVYYIFGYQCKWGAFGEIVTTKTSLKNIVNGL